MIVTVSNIQIMSFPVDAAPLAADAGNIDSIIANSDKDSLLIFSPS